LNHGIIAFKLFSTLPKPIFLRSADCLHLVTALDAGFTKICTPDPHQIGAAGALGSSVEVIHLVTNIGPAVGTTHQSKLIPLVIPPPLFVAPPLPKTVGRLCSGDSSAEQAAKTSPAQTTTPTLISANIRL
jgi:hypothetical protein